MKPFKSTKMKNILITMTGMLMLAYPITASPCYPNINEEKYGYEQCVRIYMDRTFEHVALEKGIESTILKIKDKVDLSKGECKQLAKEMVNYVYDDLVQKNVVLFKEYFTLEEMQDICKFVQTKTGRVYAITEFEISKQMKRNLGYVEDKMNEYIDIYMKKKAK